MNKEDWIEKIEDSDNLLASMTDWEDFLETRVWHDIKEMLSLVLHGIRDDLEVTGGTSFFKEEIIHLQAEAYQVRFLLELPELMINSLDIDSKTKEIEEKTNEYGNG